MKNNRYIYRVASVFIIIFICVGAYLGYFTAVESKKIVMNPYNKRLDHLEAEVVSMMLRAYFLRQVKKEAEIILMAVPMRML